MKAPRPPGRPRKGAEKSNRGRPAVRPRMRVKWWIPEDDAKELVELRERYRAGVASLLGPRPERYHAVVAMTTKLLRSRKPLVKFMLATSILYLIPETPGLERLLSRPNHPLRAIRVYWPRWLALMKTPSTAMATVRRIDMRFAKFAMADIKGVPADVVRGVKSFWRHISPTEGAARSGTIPARKE